MELLQEYIFVPLDIFKKILQNRNVDIKNKLEAWLTFLSVDDPEIILKLLKAYPQFRPMYQEVYDMCRNLEKVMHMFSKELEELDSNTVQYMIDEMQDKIDEQKQQLDEHKNQIEQNIQNLITDLKSQKKSDDEILRMLEAVFCLTPEEARARL